MTYLPPAFGRGRPPRPRMLVLRALGLGALLTAVSALRALRRAWPEHETVLAAPSWLAPAVALIGAVDRLLPASAVGRAVPERLDWTGPPPQIAVDLQGNGPRSRRLLMATAPGRLLSYAPAGQAEWREDDHERHRWCRLLTAYDIPADPDDLRIQPPDGPSPAPGATVIHPGADAPARRWPAHRFAIVARGLIRAGHEVLVTAGPGEQAIAEEVAALAGLPQSRILAAPLGTLAALIAQARAVVVGDTGPAHLATALGTPSVVLFGPVAPQAWGPPFEDPRHIAVWRPGPDEAGRPRPGDAHGRRTDSRLLCVTPCEVLDAVARLPLPDAVTVT
jgi:ADP-heptose:LPS heptosyltransferase